MSEDAIVALLKFAGWSVKLVHQQDFEGWHIAPPGIPYFSIHHDIQDVLEYFLMHRRMHGHAD